MPATDMRDDLIELEGADGISHLFRPAAIVPDEAGPCLVLVGEELNAYGEENILFARLETEEDGADLTILDDPAAIRRLYKKYCQAMEG